MLSSAIVPDGVDCSAGDGGVDDDSEPFGMLRFSARNSGVAGVGSTTFDKWRRFRMEARLLPSILMVY